MKNIIAVKPVEEYFSIDWRISLRCNYDCMYCSNEWHDTHSKHLSLEELKNIWLNVYNKTNHRNLKYKIGLTGGEPTNNKNLIPFLSWLVGEYAENIYHIGLTSNGSATSSYYLKLYKYLNAISFSLHSEFFDEKKFIETILFLKKNIDKDKLLHVCIMNEYWNASRIPLYKSIFDENNVSYSINEINFKYKIRSDPMQKGKFNLDIPTT